MKKLLTWVVPSVTRLFPSHRLFVRIVTWPLTLRFSLPSKLWM